MRPLHLQLTLDKSTTNTITKLIRLSTVALLPLLFSAPGQGASFDCAKTQSAVEKQICANPRLSKLDEQLNYVFNNAEDSAEDAGALEREEYRWLHRVRNKCLNDGCLVTAYSQQLTVVNRTKKFTWKTYTNNDLGISFSLPTNYKVEQDLPGFLTVRERRTTAAFDGLVLVELHIMKGALAENAEEEGFSLGADGGSATGRFGQEEPTTKVSRDGWEGLRATINCGWSDENGFHGGGECITELLSNGRMTVSLGTGGPEPRKEAMRLLNSIRLPK